MRTCHKFHNFFINMTLSAERQDKKIKNNPVAERNSHWSVRACDARRESPSRTIARARIHGRDEKRYDAKDAINQLLFKKNATPREMYNVQKKRERRKVTYAGCIC